MTKGKLFVGAAALLIGATALILLLPGTKGQSVVVGVAVAAPPSPHVAVDAGAPTKTERGTAVPKKDNAAKMVKWVFSAPTGVEMTKSEVTVAWYAACVAAGACSDEGVDTRTNAKKMPVRYPGCNWTDRRKYANHPMNCVTWSDAEKFCQWAGGRVTADAEWYAEASNGGLWRYPWGNQEVSSLGQCDRVVSNPDAENEGCGSGETWPVCSKPGGNSVSGLCDMLGNVGELVSSDAGIVYRGGDYRMPGELRVTIAGITDGTRRAENTGFRCARGSLDNQHD